MNLKSRYTCTVQELPVGHPAHEAGYEYEIEVQGKYKGKIFYALHYCTAKHVPLMLNYINSDIYNFYLDRTQEKKEN